MQTDAAAAAAEMFGSRYALFSRMAPVFLTSGIRKRHSVRPLEWFTRPHTWPERTQAYIEGALVLFIDAASKALDAAGLFAEDIDGIVTVSSTGISTPSLEARAMSAMGFRSDIERVPVFGLGCGGGVAGFSIASKLARAQPGANILLVAVEVCTLSFRLDELTKANIVASALFGDGAAACVLRAGGKDGLAQVEASGQHTWPDTLDIMGWRVDEQGFGVIFAQSIPPFAEQNVGPAVDSILTKNGLQRSDVDRFICHPGGAKVITALERTLSLDQGALDHERSVLEDYGNMSAPTVLFVLDAQVRAKLPPRSALLAMGPGFSASCAVLKAAA
jgi:alkylresorcinol/alkylpyrone synthase